MMKKKNYTEKDAIKELMQQEGLMQTSDGFTGRVMDQVVQIRTYGLNEYRPLIGTKGWILISLCLAMLVACCILVLFSGDGDSTGYLAFLEPAYAYFRNLEFNLNVNFGAVLTGSIVLLTVFILLTVDFVFNTKISLE